MEPLPTLSDDEPVFRTITKAARFRDGRPLSGAFIRRQRDTDGISVNYRVRSPDECAPEMKGKKAILGLLVGGVRGVAVVETKLDVIPDHIPNHANIVGAPMPPDPPDPDSFAERVAANLVRISWVAWRKDAPKLELAQAREA